MNELLLYGPIALPAVAILLILAILYQMSRSTLLMGARLDAFEKSLEMATRLIKEEIGQSRAESGRMLGDQRREVGESFRELSGGILQRISEANCAQGRQFDALTTQFSDFTRSNQEQLAHLEKQAAENSKALRSEVVSTLTDIAETVSMNMKSVGEAQKIQMDSFATHLATSARATSDKLDVITSESAAQAKNLREEVVGTLTKISESIGVTIKDLGTLQKNHMDSFFESDCGHGQGHHGQTRRLLPGILRSCQEPAGGSGVHVDENLGVHEQHPQGSLGSREGPA